MPDCFNNLYFRGFMVEPLQTEYFSDASIVFHTNCGLVVNTNSKDLRITPASKSNGQINQPL